MAAHWFADHVGKNPGGTAWDVYFLYGPDSRWEAGPSGLLTSGSPVIDGIDTLKVWLSAT